MADVLSVSFGDDLSPTLLKAPDLLKAAIQAVVDDTSKKLFRRIRLATPRDRGTAAAGWNEETTGTGATAGKRLVNTVAYINVLEFGGYPVVALKKKKAKKKKAKKKATRKSAKDLAPGKGKKKKAKQGGSKTAKPKHTPSGAIIRGAARLGGGYPPGVRTQKDGGGDPSMLSNVSRQAPKGMVRKNLEAIRPEFFFELEEAIDRALNEGG